MGNINIFDSLFSPASSAYGRAVYFMMMRTARFILFQGLLNKASQERRRRRFDDDIRGSASRQIFSIRCFGDNTRCVDDSHRRYGFSSLRATPQEGAAEAARRGIIRVSHWVFGQYISLTAMPQLRLSILIGCRSLPRILRHANTAKCQRFSLPRPYCSTYGRRAGLPPMLFFRYRYFDGISLE